MEVQNWFPHGSEVWSQGERYSRVVHSSASALTTQLFPGHQLGVVPKGLRADGWALCELTRGTILRRRGREIIDELNYLWQ